MAGLAQKIPHRAPLRLFTLAAGGLMLAASGCGEGDDAPLDAGEDTATNDADSEEGTVSLEPPPELLAQLETFCENYASCYPDTFETYYGDVESCTSYLESYYAGFEGFDTQECFDALGAYLSCVNEGGCGEYAACQPLIGDALELCR